MAASESALFRRAGKFGVLLAEALPWFSLDLVGVVASFAVWAPPSANGKWKRVKFETATPKELKKANNSTLELLADNEIRRKVFADVDSMPEGASCECLAISPTGEVWAAVSVTSSVYVCGLDGTRIRRIYAEGKRPVSIAFRPDGKALISDFTEHAICDENLRQLFGAGRSSSRPGEFSCPVSMAIDADGTIFVADAKNHRIQRLKPDGSFVCAFGQYGRGDGELDWPRSVAIGPDNHVFVADQNNNRVLVFDRAGNFVRKFGETGAGECQFIKPSCLAFDNWGNLLVTDTRNRRVQVLKPSGEYITEIGFADAFTFWGALVEMYGYPLAVCADQHGCVFVSTDTRVHCIGFEYDTGETATHDGIDDDTIRVLELSRSLAQQAVGVID